MASKTDNEITPTADMLDLETCSAPELAQSLLQTKRFHGDKTATTHFLREAVSTLVPNATANSKDAAAAAAAVTATKNESDSNDVEQRNSISDYDIGESLLPSEESSLSLSCIQPARTKFDVVFGSRGVSFRDKKGESIVLQRGIIQHCIIFPKPEDCRARKKQIADLVLLVWGDWGATTSTCTSETDEPATSTSITYKSKPLQQICFQLPPTSPHPKDPADTDADAAAGDADDEEAIDKTLEWMELIGTSLAFPVPQMARAYAPSTANNNNNNNNNGSYRFASHQDSSTSTTVSGMPFLPCYSGVQDGVLFPLREGILFCKPPRFWPRSTLHSIDCCGSNRYVTLTVVTDTSETLEFTNIHTQEQDVLRRYIHQTLIPAMRQDVAETANGGTATAKQETTNEEETGDEDMIDVVSSTGSRKRKAAMDAARVNKRATTQHDAEEDDDEDEEEDDDYHAGGGEETEEDDDDDDGEEEEEEEDFVEDANATETEGEDDDDDDDDD